MDKVKIFNDLYFCLSLEWEKLERYAKHPYLMPDRLLVVFVDNGTVCLNVNGEDYTIDSTHMLLLHSKQLVSVKWGAPNSIVSIIAFTVALQDVVFKQFDLSFFKLIHDRHLWELQPRTAKALRSFYDLFDFNYSYAQNTSSTEIASSLFTNFLQMFFHLVQPSLDIELGVGNRANGKILSGRFFILLNEHYKSEHSVAFYAGKLCISCKYLTQIIKQFSGRTPKEIIDRRLGMEAIFLLTKTSYNIQEVSIELGFPDQSYFGRFFKRLFGMSPLNYKLNPDMGLLDKLEMSPAN